MNTRIVLLMLASVVSLVGSALGAWWFLIQPSRYKRPLEKKGTKRVVLVTTLLITGTLTLIAGFSGDFRPSGVLSYRGRVVDAIHRPIQGAKVTVEGQGPPLIAYTDSAGVFTYATLTVQASIVRITVEAPGYERYQDYVLLPSKEIDITLIRITPTPTPLASGCPAISASCPDVVHERNTVIFTAIVKDERGGATTTYNWLVSAGTIIGGQGTSSITVDTTNLNGQTVTATVEIGGFSATCARTASCSTAVAQ